MCAFLQELLQTKICNKSLPKWKSLPKNGPWILGKQETEEANLNQ